MIMKMIKVNKCNNIYKYVNVCVYIYKINCVSNTQAAVLEGGL